MEVTVTIRGRCLLERTREIQEALKAGRGNLAVRFTECNPGFWSFYDASNTSDTLSCHRSFLAQLRALELTFPKRAQTFRRVRAAFERQLKSHLKLLRALLLKACQKLHHPPEFVLH